MLANVGIGDVVTLVAPSGKTSNVVVTDVIRCIFSGEPIALEFTSKVDGSPVQLPINYFRIAAA